MSKVLLYFSDNCIDGTRIDARVKTNLKRISAKYNYRIVSVTHKPVEFGKNFIMPNLIRCRESIILQIIHGLSKLSPNNMVFLVEHDVLDHESRFWFKFKPNMGTKIAYNANYYRSCPSGYVYKTPSDKVLSQCCGKAEDLLREMVKIYQTYVVNGIKTTLEPGRDGSFNPVVYNSTVASVDIRHNMCVTGQFFPESDKVGSIDFWGCNNQLRKSLGLTKPEHNDSDKPLVVWLGDVSGWAFHNRFIDLSSGLNKYTHKYYNVNRYVMTYATAIELEDDIERADVIMVPRPLLKVFANRDKSKVVVIESSVRAHERYSVDR